MSNRSASNKPLPRKQRVLNRGYLYSRSDEDIKNPEVTLMDMDGAIMSYFDDVIKPSLQLLYIVEHLLQKMIWCLKIN